MKCKNCTDSTCKYRTSDAEKECFYQEEQKQIRQTLYGHEVFTFEQMKEMQQIQLQYDYEALRNQAAIAAMQAQVSSFETMEKFVSILKERGDEKAEALEILVAMRSVAYADALIEELKKK